MAKERKQKAKYNGWVYVLKIWIGSEVIFKIGTTNRKPYTRMLEVAGELYRALAYIPKMTIVREQQTKNNYAVEAEILKETAKHRYNLPCVKDVCGESELRLMNDNELYAVYANCVNKDYPAEIAFKIEL